MSDDQEDRNSVFDVLEEMYLEERGDDYLHFSPEGVEDIELAMKVKLFFHYQERTDLSKRMDKSWSLESVVLARIYNDIADIHDEIYEEFRKSVEGLADEDEEKELEKFLDVIFHVEASENVLLYYTLAKEIVQGIAGDIIHDRIFEDDQEGLNYARNMDLVTQENILYHMGEIDDGLKGEIANIRKTRNRLVHEIRERHFLESMDNPQSMLDRTMDTIDTLHEKAHGKSPFNRTPRNI